MSRLAWSQWSVEYVCDDGCTCLVCRLSCAHADAAELILDYLDMSAWPHYGVSAKRRDFVRRVREQGSMTDPPGKPGPWTHKH